MLFELQAKLLDRTRDCIYALDEQGNIFYANETSFNTYGYSRDEFLGMNVKELTTKENILLVTQRMEELIAKGEITFTRIVLLYLLKYMAN